MKKGGSHRLPPEYTRITRPLKLSVVVRMIIFRMIVFRMLVFRGLRRGIHFAPLILLFLLQLRVLGIVLLFQSLKLLIMFLIKLLQARLISRLLGQTLPLGILLLLDFLPLLVLFDS